MKTRRLDWERVGSCIQSTSHRGIFGTLDYPQISIKGKQQLLHREVCRRRHGDISGLMARHTCDNPKCINPDHLIPGTAADNSRDRNDRKRNAFGARIGCAKLTDLTAMEIYTASGTHREIGLRFGVNHRVVGRIKKKERWKHIH